MEEDDDGEVERFVPTGIVTDGKGDSINILVNDSFSTSQHSQTRGSRKGRKSSKQAGFSAMEILQMKDAQKIAKPTAKPVVYFKDFEKRFDDLL